MKHYMMLKRNLVYTGVTRAKKLLVIIGEEQALSMAITNDDSSHRLSKLKEWLIDENLNLLNS
jgi:exodeoxyribonuclease V alpha subunit